ncbi:MAG: CDP-alcohol phosphatidyltransferase family protein [Lachnospiraceae bacterium]|nr:CDP-alcohol phosphatidyltransferase family protein [Lachnospiraceae bacterium]
MVILCNTNYKENNILGRRNDVANLITGCRILCSIVIPFIPALSQKFYVLYLIAGFTDMIDGTVARKTGTVSELGSKLDTVADFVFVAVCLIKLIPILEAPMWLWIWTGVIALIKMINVISGFIVEKRFVAEHTIMNKITGFLLFVLPMTLTFIDLKYSAIVVCTVGTFAAIQEGHYIRTKRFE